MDAKNQLCMYLSWSKMDAKNQLFMCLSWLKNGVTMSIVAWLFDTPKSLVLEQSPFFSNFHPGSISYKNLFT